ncbi:hypothetical protein L107_13870 [Cyanobium sp. Copco_Reservoir_LC18]|uniref:AAA family ATPase n=1 Tax=Cyanobium sp. Copco_Reservoir_LC18 TaxID=1328305 RepID=UPI001356B5F8|nr:AAA family ATPase [Cyanobium sp. Copco_Reservoir_LC18]KAF0652401.1 hypothetical protein L107_13870 [Cyanobium sp. Copco_Reservoir_LC18]
MASHRADLLALPCDFRMVRVGRDKAPIAGKNWFDHDDFSPDDAAELNGNGPPAWGLKCGPASGGALVLDLDAEGWDESFQRVTGHPITDLPPTISWTSGKRNRSGHVFAVPDEWWPHLKNRQPFTRPWREGDPLGKNGKPEPITLWELRWDRHQSVIIGAHPETGAYRWLPGCSPQEIPDPAPAPDWLLEALLVQEHPDAAPVEPTADDAGRALAMLAYIDPVAHSTYDAWLRVGMALHHTDPGLLCTWVEWCRPMPAFNEAECLAKWESFGKGHKGRPATIRTLHYLAKQGGYREPKRSSPPPPPHPGGDPPEQEEQQEEQPASKGPQTFDERWSALEQYAAELARSEWPTIKALAALASCASDLEVTRLTQRNLEQLLEAAQRGLRATSAPILPGSTFEVNPTPWAVNGLFRHGLNLLVGQSGAGKSRLMASLMAAWLRGDPTWLQRELQGPPAADRHALIIGTDQGREDWHQTLTPVGLCTLLPDGKTVQLHDRLTLYPMESGALLDADTMRMIRRWVDEHPGGMVAVDSLATCLPPGVDEDKSAAAGPVHALQDAISGGWGVLTHHTRKGAGKEGNLGVGAGRGSGAIDAAVSRVIGLGLIHKMESGQLLPQESDPRRELLSTKRGGPPIHLIVSSDHTGAWDCHGSADELKRQQRQEHVLENLTEQQREILAALEDNEGKTMTARDVVEALGHDWGDGTGKKPASIRRTMRTLAGKGLLVCKKVGVTLTFCLPDDAEG